MSFGTDLHGFKVALERTTQEVFVAAVLEVQRSVVHGSEITGAPGQPIDTGHLRASWQTTFDSPTSALISTNVEYAQAVEDNVQGHRFRNHGPHSVHLTEIGFPKIATAVARRLSRGTT
jgi:hypothetical protein